ncbi:MAG: hypothetical protein L0221_05815, partial [Chloroflexi bacterium]|nr:hypothetical protein [Chloroflexota bacterium]
MRARHSSGPFVGLTLALALLLASRAEGAAIGPIGGEFQANTTTAANQTFPAVAGDGAGNFVVVWATQFAGAVFGQRYDADGDPLGTEFQVDPVSGGSNPAVAADAAGGFVVTWTRSSVIFARRYDTSGTPVGPEFQLSTGSGQRSAVAARSSGFVVVWDDGHIRGRQLDPSGVPQGSEFQVDDSAGGYNAALATDAAANFVVAWQRAASGVTSVDVFAKRFDASAVALGPEFQVNTYVTGRQDDPSVAADAAGNFIVAWDGRGQDDNDAASARRYDATGTPLGPPFFADASSPSHSDDDFSARVAADAAGNFVISWNRADDRFVVGDTYAMMVQRFDASGMRLGTERRVSGRARFNRHSPAIAADGSRNVAVVWVSYGQDGDQGGIFGQRLFGTETVVGQRFAFHDGPTRTLVFSSRDAAIRTFADPVSDGAFLHIYNTAGTGEATCISLPSAGWEARGSA